MRHPNATVMRKVLALAAKEKTVAAAVVKGNKIISLVVCTVFTKGNPTGHGEINALRAASKKLKTHHLDGCWLYSSLQCCPMCSAAACWADVSGVVYSASGGDMPKWERHDWCALAPEKIFKFYAPHPKLVKNFLRSEGKKALNWTKPANKI